MENIQVQRQLSEKIYSPDEMASYRKFAHKTQTLSDAELFKVNNSLTLSDPANTIVQFTGDCVIWKKHVQPSN